MTPSTPSNNKNIPRKASPPYVNIEGVKDGDVGVQMDFVITLVGASADDWIIDLKDPDYLDDYSYSFNPLDGSFSFTPSKEGRYILKVTALDSEPEEIATGIRNFNAEHPQSTSSLTTSSLTISTESSKTSSVSSNSSESSKSTKSSLYGYFSPPTSLNVIYGIPTTKNIIIQWEWENESSATPDEPDGFVVERKVGDSQWEVVSYDLSKDARTYSDILSDTAAAQIFVYGKPFYYRVRAFWIE